MDVERVDIVREALWLAAKGMGGDDPTSAEEGAAKARQLFGLLKRKAALRKGEQGTVAAEPAFDALHKTLEQEVASVPPAQRRIMSPPQGLHLPPGAVPAGMPRVSPQGPIPMVLPQAQQQDPSEFEDVVVYEDYLELQSGLSKVREAGALPKAIMSNRIATNPPTDAPKGTPWWKTEWTIIGVRKVENGTEAD